jgi:flagellar M-ring protein FliF
VAVSKSKKKKREAEAQAAAEAAAMAGVPLTPDEVLAAQADGEVPVGEIDAGADVMTLQSERGMELRKSIRKFVDENPELAAQMVRIWLRGGEELG